jgi:hypothetical protein
MEKLAVPWMFLGPSGSGKLTTARKYIEAAHGKPLTLPLEAQVFNVGDGYKARVLTSPYHFEIDIPNLSMQDKQIIGELLTTFFASGDVFSGLRTGTRKLVILRRAHSLSLPAAIRVRAILQQHVLPPDAAGMLWISAREMTGPLALLEDAFVKHRVPRISLHTWTSNTTLPLPLRCETAWTALEGRMDRATEVLKFFPDGVVPEWPRRIQDFYDELLLHMLRLAQKPPSLASIQQIRAKIYQALSFCQTGPEIIDSCAGALQRQHALLEPQVFWRAMKALTSAEPHTSYRTPLSLEAGLLALYETLRGARIALPAAAAAAPTPAPTLATAAETVKSLDTARARATPAPQNDVEYAETSAPSGATLVECLHSQTFAALEAADAAAAAKPPKKRVGARSRAAKAT